MEKIQIANSVYLNKINIKKFKTNFICIDFVVPLTMESASKAALLAFVLKHGCEKYPNIANIARKAEDLYGAELDISIRKRGDSQVVSFYIDYVDDSFLPAEDNMTAEAVELLNNIIFNPLVTDDSFNAEYVEIEKSNLKSIINARKNNKTSYAVKRCAEIITENQPHSIYEYGNIDILNSITAKDLYDYYNEFISKAVVYIFTVGNFENIDLTSVYKNIFSSTRDPYSLIHLKADLASYKEETETAIVEQAKLSLGFIFNKEGLSQTAVSLFLILFAASPNSLLFMNVREKLSLCYYCSATIDKFKDFMVVYSGVLPEKVETAKEEILNQLNSVVENSFSDEDFSAAKQSYLNSLDSIYDNAVSIEEYALSASLRNAQFNIEKTKEELAQLTRKDIANVAKGMKLVLKYTLYNEENRNDN